MDIVLRSLVVFVVLLLVTRLLGKRSLGEMNAFEIVLLVVMGDLVQQGVTQEDYSMTGAFLAVGTMSLAAAALSFTSWRFPGTRPVIEGVPTVVVRDGAILTDVADAEQLPVDDILEAMREKGIRDPAEVDLGVIEPDGKFSFFTRSGG
jgi:uncharacterized membrane protein YcaP (DUF421 family)